MQNNMPVSSIGFICREDLILQLGSRRNSPALANAEKVRSSPSPSFLFRSTDLTCRPRPVAYGGLSEGQRGAAQ